MMKRLKRQAGFTLVELLAVLVILGIIMAIAVPRIFGLIEQARYDADIASVDLLNHTTSLARMNNRDTDPFLDANHSSPYLLDYLYDEGYLAKPVEPQSRDSAFLWLNQDQRWALSSVDAGNVMSVEDVFKAAMATSGITYSDFLTKDRSFNVGSPPYTEYNVNSWNGYLEKLLEAGDVSSNVRLDEQSPQYGNNALNYLNPFSENEYRGVVLNVLNRGVFNYLRNNDPYRSMIPPAIILTRDHEFEHSRANSPFIQDNLDMFKGAMIFYKDNSWTNDRVQVYYFQADGSKSDLIPIADILNP